MKGEKKMSTFRFAIMGAGRIAVKFCNAVKLLDDCEVCAIASKSTERADAFAKKNGIEKYYGGYEQMLEEEKPDCVYIAVTPNDHYRLTMLCITHEIPVLCEKAMFQNSEEAQNAFRAAAQKNVFIMEALWSRYLPAVNKVRSWVREGRIGIPEISQFFIGFLAPDEKENRYFNPQLGGGAAKDLTVYAYEITRYVLEQEIRKIKVSAKWSDTGVDISNHISIDFEHTLADLTASLAAGLEEKMVLYGRYGKIVMPLPHYASECMLYDEKGVLLEQFQDLKTENGFVYEIEDVMRCIKDGKIQSDIVPWQDTLDCAHLFDRIYTTVN